MYLFKRLAAATALLRLTAAFPAPDASHVKRDDFPSILSDRIPPYQTPGPNDSRGPCPGLNTLANHGLINRNGKNINSSDIMTAFPRGFGINMDGFVVALENFAVVCEYIEGRSCASPAKDGTFLLTNLTLLGEPHAFEHDHSYSRQDYMEKYAKGGITDNIYFNSTEFQTSLDVVHYTPHNPPVARNATFSDFNEIRLQRESIQKQADFPGSFQQNIPPTLFETGFIFGATFDRDANGTMLGKEPQVRLDWWNFWFSEESFPTQLGWVPASTEVFNFSFISSVSRAVLGAPITSLPSPLPHGATNTSQPLPTVLPAQDPSPVVPLFQSPPYVAPTAPASISPEAKRNALAAPAPTPQGLLPSLLPSLFSVVASEITAAPSIITSALDLVGPAPSKFNPYVQALDISSLEAQIAQAQSYESAVLSAISSLAGDL